MKLRPAIAVFHAALFATLLAVSPAGSGSMSLLGAGKPSGVVASYSGPGDVVAGATAWWGLRAYSLATAGTRAARICNSGDANCADVNTLANGNFDVATAQGAPLNCGGAGGTCTVKTLYDQTVGTYCSGSTPCDVTNSTAANRPTLTFNCVGSLPCLTNVNGKSLDSVAITGTVQPYTFSWVAERTASTTAFSCVICTAGTFDGFANAANLADIYAGSHVTATANDNVIHAAQTVFNGASSSFYIDGSTTGVSAGSAATASFFHFGTDTFGDDLNGIYFEGGFWGSGFNGTQAGNMNTNQHSYWGF